MSDLVVGALVAFGWSERVLALFNDLLLPGLAPARVVRVERSTCAAVFCDGDERILHASALPAVGDWVAVEEGTVAQTLPRWSSLVRADPSGTATQVLAANIDIVAITAPADRLSLTRVERELAIAWDSGANPLVVLTKADLAGDGVVAGLSSRLVGVDILATSAVTGLGVSDLAQRLRPSLTAVMLGPSGAGKSSLVNALIGSDRFATAEVRSEDQRGRHTTTSRQLVAVPGGGVLIDTPGLRSLGLSGDVTVGTAFPEIEALAAGCRFADCRHESEPASAVLAAVAENALDPARFDSYRKLQREVAAETRRVDPVARRQQLAFWKARTKLARLDKKRKPR